MELRGKSAQELLAMAVGNTQGALAAGLVRMDGESLAVHNTVQGFDTTVADKEFAEMMAAGRRAAENLGITGSLEELIFAGEQAVVLIRMVDAHHYTGMACTKDANLGMARMQQKKILPYLEDCVRY